MNKVRIILASNHELWWEGLLHLIKERSPEFEVLAICYDAMETIDKANRFKPDVLLLDEELAGGDCGEVAQRISCLHPEINIIIVIKPYKIVSLSSSFKAQAKAYIDKDITYYELANSIIQVAKGGIVVISPMVARKLLEQVANYGDKVHAQAEYDIGLSKRENEVLTLLAKGTTNKEIATALHITENTVKAHLSHIMEKMQVSNRQQAAIIARQSGIIPESDLTNNSHFLSEVLP